METGNNPLTVARYLRNFRGLSMMNLAERLHLPFMTVLNLEHGRGSNLGTLRKAAKFYGVSLDCLARSDMAAAASQISSPAIAHNLRYQELADRLGVGSREAARVICKRETARKRHILTLALYELLSPEEFLERYLPSDVEED